jgi:MFS family permease
VLGALSTKYLGMRGPGWTAASLCALNFVWAAMRLAESWKPSSHSVTQRPHLQQWLHVLSAPRLNLLVLIFFLATFCFSSFETTIGLLVIKNFGINPEASLTKTSWLIAYCGVIGALSQGGVRRSVKKIGEGRLIAVSLFLAAVGIGVLPFLLTWWTLFIGLAVFAIGSSLTRPPVFGMISMLTPSTEQGATMGVAQGVGSLARIAGPVFAASIFVIHAKVPFLVCAGLCFVTAFIAMAFLSHPKPQPSPAPV